MASPGLEVVPAEPDQAPLLANLLELYAGAMEIPRDASERLGTAVLGWSYQEPWRVLEPVLV